MPHVFYQCCDLLGTRRCQHNLSDAQKDAINVWGKRYVVVTKRPARNVKDVPLVHSITIDTPGSAAGSADPAGGGAQQPVGGFPLGFDTNVETVF